MVGVSSVEDLMREHSVLNKILLCYEEIINRLLSDTDHANLCKLTQYCAAIINRFIEHYHEQTEEKYVFPLLIKNNIEVDLANELILQHRISRVITKKIYQLAGSCNNIYELIRYMRLFIKMYRAHENKEDLIIFQKFRKLLSDEEYKKMSQIFEEDEEKTLGKDGYKKVNEIVILIAKRLNIDNLKNITLNVVDNMCI